MIYVANKRVLFVYGGESVKKNGHYDDVKKSVENVVVCFFELTNAS